MLIQKTVKDFIETTASNSPAPGGGSVAALSGGLGAALTSMVGNLTFGKKAYNELGEDVKAKLHANFDDVEKLLVRLNELVDEDTNAFDDVMAAFKMPKETDEEKKARSAAIQEGTKKAMEVPLDTAKRCLDILKLQEVFAHHGNKNAITDVGVGSLMAYAGLEGALFNVLINLNGLKDKEYVESVKVECDKLLAEGKELKENVLQIVYSKL